MMNTKDSKSGKTCRRNWRIISMIDKEKGWGML